MKELTAVGVVVGAPDQRTLATGTVALGGRLFRPRAPAKQVTVADGVVAGIERVAFPFELEQSFGDTALVAGVAVDRAPSLRRPADDLDREISRVTDQAAVACERLVGCGEHRRLMYAPYAGGGRVGNLARVDVHGTIVLAR